MIGLHRHNGDKHETDSLLNLVDSVHRRSEGAGRV